MSRNRGRHNRVRLVVAFYGMAAVVAYGIILLTVVAILGLSLGAWVASGSPKPFVLASGFAGLVYWFWFSDQTM